MESIAYLKKITLFKLLRTEELELLSKRLTSHTYDEGDMVIQELEESTALYILIEGEVNVVLETDGIEFVIEELHADQFFGEMALLDGKPRSAGVICVSACKLLRLASEDFYEVLERNPNILRSLVLELCDRLRKANEKIKGISNYHLTF